MFVKIEFEDNSQDFLSFVIDTKEQKVVTAQPFQHSIWAEQHTPQQAFEVGGYVEIWPLKDPARSFKIKHKIANIHILHCDPEELRSDREQSKYDIVVKHFYPAIFK